VPYLQHLRPDHDEDLIVRLAADDVSGREADEARRLVATCPACAELLADIRAISAATAALPAPRRPRDLRLTEADAARLRPSGWRGWLARFGGQGYAFTKPLATGLAALGVAGLLLAAVPGGLTGLGSSGAAESARNAAEAPITDQALGIAPSTVPGDVQASMAPVGPTVVGPEAGAAASPPVPAKGTVADASAAAAASAPPAGAPGTPGATGGYGATASGPTTGTTGAGNLAPSGSGTGTAGVLNPPQATPAPSPSPLVLVSVVLLAAGIGLGLLRWAARRAR
jgi:hypothetical protein